MLDESSKLQADRTQAPPVALEGMAARSSREKRERHKPRKEIAETLMVIPLERDYRSQTQASAFATVLPVTPRRRPITAWFRPSS
jgi:hypothetical protein